MGRASPRPGDRGKMLAVPGRRRELAEGLRTLGAGRSGADLPDLAAPPPSAGPGLLTSARGLWAMSHRPGGGGGGGKSERARELPSPNTCAVVGAPPTPQVCAPPRAATWHFLLRWLVGVGRQVGCCCDSLQDPMVAPEKV